MPSFRLKHGLIKRSLILSAIGVLVGGTAAFAQTSPITGNSQTAAGTNRPLNLAKNSPFRDPDIIYLEADELINSEDGRTLTAQGDVEGRYQDRTLRAQKVVYNLDTGEVFASGNVVLIDATGATQYADQIELSSALETGTATNFTARFPEGGITGGALATRTSNEEVELYNAYYTACEPCQNEDGTVDSPTWRLKARKVSQDRKRNMIRYRDAILELKGIPVFYTPYLAHPDPSVGRTSGFLNPFGGLSSSKGINLRMPYFWAIDDYSDLTVTPRIFQKVSPVMSLDYRRRFFSGDINLNGSFTYGSIFDRNGDALDENDVFSPADAPVLGKRLRSHLFADALFQWDENWTYGGGFQAASDDLYLNRYDLNENPARFGLYDGGSRRLVSQAFVVGQDENFRFSTSAYGFQSLRTSIRERDDGSFRVRSEDDSTLPIIAPKIEAEYYFQDPITSGRLHAFGDATMITREIGDDYTRASGGLNWSKSIIAPGGIEVQPFGQVRADYFELDPDGADKVDFGRITGQVGIDARWPFIKSPGDVDLIIEPRVQVTQNFGDGKLDRFDEDDDGDFDLFQDSQDIDLDQALLWSPNKATGYDFWQKGTRADVGASFIADWDKSRAHLFVGQSYADGNDEEYSLASGLRGNKSDLVGLFELDLGGKIKSTTRVRYDEDESAFRRLDTSLSYKNKWLSAKARYYKLDSATFDLQNDDAPREEVSGTVTLKLLKNWSARYKASHDIDADLTRRQNLSFIYDDQCTRIELIYSKRNTNGDAVRDSDGFGIRISLLSLGDFSPK